VIGLPLRYSLRNLLRRKVRTALTVIAIGLAVGVTVGLFAFARGVLSAARYSGSPDNVVIMDRNAASATFSSVSQADINLLMALPQVARNEQGLAMISPEVVHQSAVTLKGHPERPGTLRGVTPRAMELNRNLRILEGQPPSSGRNVMVGDLAAAALRVPPESLRVGAVLEFERQEWTIVGRFTTGGSALDSDILVDLGDIMAVQNRNTVSTLLVRANSAADVPVLVRSVTGRTDIQLKAVPETEYYRSLSEGYERIIMLVALVSVMAAIGGLISGMNTMYASVIGRLREIATLKILGFGNRRILAALLVESVVLALIGAALGIALALPVDGMGARFTSSAVRVSVDAWAIGGGVAVALTIGVFGLLAPAWRGLRKGIPDALNTT
jgi:putative ABC transport system permease protein